MTCVTLMNLDRIGIDCLSWYQEDQLSAILLLFLFIFRILRAVLLVSTSHAPSSHARHHFVNSTRRPGSSKKMAMVIMTMMLTEMISVYQNIFAFLSHDSKTYFIYSPITLNYSTKYLWEIYECNDSFSSHRQLSRLGLLNMPTESLLNE